MRSLTGGVCIKLLTKLRRNQSSPLPPRHLSEYARAWTGTESRKPATTWVEPRFDAEITYAEITDDGMVRHPVFKSLFARTRSGKLRAQLALGR